MHAWSDWLNATLAAREKCHQLRTLRPLHPTDGLRARAAGGAELVLFSTNDYLDLSSHPALRDAAQRALASIGMGPRGAALVCGHTHLHEELCDALARCKGTEAALLFPTGYAANLAAITALADADCAIFSDALNHASIIDATRLARRAGAEVSIYRHRDAQHLEDLLRQSTRPRRLIVTDSVFSMDGTLAPLPELASLRDRYGALLIVDEAHGTLVFGASGGGVAEHLGVADRVDLHVGTLSKAMGALGGFAAASRRMVAVLLNRGRSGIYSTALPLPIVAAARAALDVPDLGARRARVMDLSRRVAQTLGIEAASPILPLVFGREDAALQASADLLATGFHAVAIRPPTVPAGTSRLRITLSAGHSDDEVEHLCAALAPIVGDCPRQ